MPLHPEQVEFLQSLGPGHTHASIIRNKWNDPEIDLFYSCYEEFHKKMESADTVAQAVKALNAYKNHCFVTNWRSGKYIFRPQSSFEPSIIEEFFARLLKQKIGNGVLLYGKTRAVSNLVMQYKSIAEFKEGPNEIVPKLVG